MKRLSAIVMNLVIIFTLSIPVYAEGVNVLSDNGDRVCLFENVKIDKTVNGNVISVFGDVELDADVNGLVIAVFGDVKVNSRVSGQVINVIGDTRLGAKCIVMGDIISLGQLHKENGAEVLGQEVNIFGNHMKFDISELLAVRVVLLMMFYIIVFLIGMLYIAASRNKIEGMEAGIENDFGKKILLGFMAFTGATIILVLLFITIIVPILYFALLIFSSIITSILLGKLIMRAMRSSGTVFMKFTTGLITITLVQLMLTLLIPGQEAIISILMPGIISLLINSFGIGTLFITKYGKK